MKLTTTPNANPPYTKKSENQFPTPPRKKPPENNLKKVIKKNQKKLMIK
jgi:hypothetical protein